jgi:hypothetical protein
MSGAHRLAVSEISVGDKKLKGEAYLRKVEEEMLEIDEGSEEDIKSDKTAGYNILGGRNSCGK